MVYKFMSEIFIHAYNDAGAPKYILLMAYETKQHHDTGSEDGPPGYGENLPEVYFRFHAVSRSFFTGCTS
jgi:hypothetical protein